MAVKLVPLYERDTSAEQESAGVFDEGVEVPVAAGLAGVLVVLVLALACVLVLVEGG